MDVKQMVVKQLLAAVDDLPDANEMVDVHERFLLATESLAESQRLVDAQTAHLQRETAVGLADGRFVGPNKETREAAARKALDKEYHGLEVFEDNLRAARLQLTLAQIRLDHLRRRMQLVDLRIQLASELQFVYGSDLAAEDL